MSKKKNFTKEQKHLIKQCIIDADQCFKCRKEIDVDHQIYFVFIGKTSTNNAEYCTDCYLQDVRDMKELDPSLAPIYSKNFIRMNK